MALSHRGAGWDARAKAELRHAEQFAWPLLNLLNYNKVNLLAGKELFAMLQSASALEKDRSIHVQAMHGVSAVAILVLPCPFRRAPCSIHALRVTGSTAWSSPQGM